MEFQLHHEFSEGRHVFWAESDDWPGFSACESTVAKLKKAVRNALESEHPESTAKFRIGPMPADSDSSEQSAERYCVLEPIG